MLNALSIGKQNQDFTTPFQPRDYNKSKFKFEFSKEYLNEATPTENSEAPKTESPQQTTSQEIIEENNDQIE